MINIWLPILTNSKILSHRKVFFFFNNSKVLSRRKVSIHIFLKQGEREREYLQKKKHYSNERAPSNLIVNGVIELYLFTTCAYLYPHLLAAER